MPNSHQIIEPGATLGVLGGGQLGRMFAQAAQRLGYRVVAYADQPDSPAGQVAHQEIVGAYDDLDAIGKFAQAVDVVTFEFENISSAAAQAIQNQIPVHPKGDVLHISQNRIREKSTLFQAGLPVTPFQAVRSEAELASAIERLGLPAILKTAEGGYDGKGQIAISSSETALTAWQELGQVECVLEQHIQFNFEVSVIGVRGLDHSIRTFGPVRNEHSNHILDLSVYPDPQIESLVDEAAEITRGVLEHLDVIGVMCVEMFVTPENKLLINEVAPRPHNSGHLTIEACNCSQFEQQVRSICGLPLGEMNLLKPAAMVNLLGDVWDYGTPNWAAALQIPEVSLHLYGKHAPRPGRKMGHVTALAETPEQAIEKAINARHLIIGNR